MMRTILLTVFAALVLAGCVRRYEFGPDAYDDPAALLAEVRQGMAAPEAVAGEAKVRVTNEEGSFAADHIIAARLPESLRMETLSFFGNPLALLRVDAGELLLWDLRENRAYVGPASPESLGTLVPVGLDPATMIRLFLGTPPLLDEITRFQRDEEARAYRIRLGEGNAYQELLVDPGALTLRQITWYRDHRAVGRLVYDRYRRAGRGLFPYEAEYEAAGGGKVEIDWHDVDLDPELDPIVFQVSPGPEVEVLPLRGAARPAEPLLPREEPTTR